MRRLFNMPKLEVKEHKKLILVKVLKKELRGVSLDSIDQEITKFSQKLDLLKVQVFGPLVIHNIGTNIHEDGTMTMDYDLIIQAHDYMQYKNEFIIEDRLVCEHCLYIHFDGRPEDLSYAHMKIDLYEYENDLVTKGEMYTVCISEGENHVVMDLFKPVVFA